jgi:hypothetical protein
MQLSTCVKHKTKLDKCVREHAQGQLISYVEPIILPKIQLNTSVMKQIVFMVSATVVRYNFTSINADVANGLQL